MSESLDYNAQLFLDALIKAGFTLDRVGSTAVFVANRGNQMSLVYDVTTNATSYTAGWIASDKWYTKKILNQAQIPTAPGKVFAVTKNSITQALQLAEELIYPVVVKPTQSGQGTSVYAQLETPEELSRAISSLEAEGWNHFLLEKHVFGREYRLFITQLGFFAAVERIPANITGDGTHTIKELIEIENERRLNPRTTCLCSIKVDEILRQYLRKQNLTLDSVLATNQYVQLRPTSNVSQGGNCIDVTDQLHPTVKSFAEKVLNAVTGLSIAGIDLICEDASRDLLSQSHVVCELNPVPGLSLHTVPEKGTFRDTPGAVAALFSAHQRVRRS